MDGKVSVVFNRNCFPKMKDFSRLGLSRAVTYTVKVAVLKKRCNTDTLLVHTTRQYHVAYRFVPFPLTLKVIRMLQDLSYRCNSTSMCATFRTVSADRARRAVSRRQLSVLFSSSRAVNCLFCSLLGHRRYLCRNTT